jgi:hypothetical protein
MIDEISDQQPEYFTGFFTERLALGVSYKLKATHRLTTLPQRSWDKRFYDDHGSGIMRHGTEWLSSGSMRQVSHCRAITGCPKDQA